MLPLPLRVGGALALIMGGTPVLATLRVADGLSLSVGRFGGGELDRESALGQSATAAAILTVGAGRMTRQSALGQKATGAASLTAGDEAMNDEASINR